MSSFKKLSKSDVTVVPYYANKQWNQSYCPYPTSSEFLTIYKGTNVTGSFSLDDDPVTEGQYERLVYSQINHLFYQSYTASLNTSSLMFTLNNYESASQQRPTSSYFIYNDSDNLIQTFPTGFNDSGSIRVIAVNQDIYGSKVLPNHFILSSSAYYVVDDGFGNLYNLSASSAGAYISGGYFNPDEYFVSLDINAADIVKTHVGNIFYAHGLGIITNPDYQTMFPLPPIAKNDSGSFLTTDSKVISASLNDYARSGTLNTGSLILSGSTSGDNYSWATGSNGTIVLTTTVAGTYSVYYTIGADIAGSCAIQLRSNKAKVTAIVTSPTTTTTTTSTTTSTTTLPPTTTTTTSTTTSTTTPPPTTTTTTTTSTTTSTTTVPPTTTTSTTTSTTTVPPTTTTTTTSTTTTTTTSSSPVEYQIDNAATGTSNDACNSSTTTSIVYAQPGYTVPIVGMFLYTNTGLTTPFVGSSGWRKLTGPLGYYAVEINASGEITNYLAC
jgi:hypothetical protein